MNLIACRNLFWLQKKVVSQIWMIMKLTTIFMLAVCLHAHAKGHSQKLTISHQNVALEKVFKEISKQTGYTFIYTENLLQKGKKISISTNNASVEQVLKECFKDQSLTYSIVDKYIIIKEKEEEVQKEKVFSSLPPPPVNISGKVTNDKGEPLNGATISEKRTTNTAVTKEDGSFTINTTAAKPVLVVSYVGYETKEFLVSNQTNVNITLAHATTNLNDVIVVGYGKQKRVNVTGSISTVDMKAKENTPLTNATQALQGVQGVYVNQAGGQPGRDNATIRIRGQGTLNDNSALILVNGIEFPLSEVNPNDIESISVLKDAASASIYGSRAANGVILVTTKTAKNRFQVKYNNYVGTQVVNYLPDVVKDPIQFMQLRNKAQINGGRFIVDYSDQLIEEYRQGMKTDPYTYPSNDWFDIMFNPGSIQDHNLQFSSGADKINYTLSLDYLDQKGVMMGSNSNKYSLGFTASSQISKRLKIGSNINGTSRIINEPAAGVQNLMGSILKAQAFHPTYLSDGRYANTFVRTSGHNIFRHPIVLATEGENRSRQQRYLVNLFAEYELPFSITYKINAGINKLDDLNTTFVPDIFIYDNKSNAPTRVPFNGDAEAVSQQNRSIRKTQNSGLNTTLFNTLNWAHSFQNSHNISALFGFSYESFSDSYFWAQNEGYLGNDLRELNAGSSNPTVAGSSTSSKLNSYFGRLGYNFKEKYLFEANFRYDGSSRFARNNRWGLFPSFSAGWRLNKEHFLENVNWISDLKIRASWGQLGNERIALFRYLNLISLGQDYPFGSSISAGAAVTAYNDPNITWETTTITNVGLDAGFFNNKVSLVFDVFKKRTSDILRPINLPAQVGNLAGPIRNIGTVDNTGFELGLDYQNRFNNFTYKVNGSITKIINKVIDLKEQTIYNDKLIITQGHPINSYNLLHAVGIFQTQEEINSSPFQTKDTKPGYLKYQDTNGDGVITEDDRVIIGGVIPKYTYQFSINLGYRGFELSSFFQGVQNINTYAGLIAAQPFWSGTAVQKEWITDAWTPENRNARLPILTTFESSVNENFRNSDFWLRDASYLRMKNLQISYTIPKKISGKIVSNIKVFANGQNLFTFSKMKDFDPEKNISGSTFYEYPTVKMYTAGLNVTF